MEIEQIKYALALATTIMNLQTGAVIQPQVVIPMTQTEAIVREYFADIPVMAEIARCESRFRQFDAQGNVLKGKVTPADKGVMQINTYWHPDAIGKIETLKGNMSYARKLFEAQGTKPWNSSKKCWNVITGKKGVV